MEVEFESRNSVSAYFVFANKAFYLKNYHPVQYLFQLYQQVAEETNSKEKNNKATVHSW